MAAPFIVWAPKLERGGARFIGLADLECAAMTDDAKNDYKDKVAEVRLGQAS